MIINGTYVYDKIEDIVKNVGNNIVIVSGLDRKYILNADGLNGAELSVISDDGKSLIPLGANDDFIVFEISYNNDTNYVYPDIDDGSTIYTYLEIKVGISVYSKNCMTINQKINSNIMCEAGNELFNDKGFKIINYTYDSTIKETFHETVYKRIDGELSLGIYFVAQELSSYNINTLNTINIKKC